jgi:nitroreductase
MLIEGFKLAVCRLLLDKHFYDEIAFFTKTKLNVSKDTQFIESTFRITIHQLDKKLAQKYEKLDPFLKNSIAMLQHYPNLNPSLREWGQKVISLAQNKSINDIEHSKYENSEQGIKNLIMTRRSIRSYSDKIIPEHHFQQIIECGLWAPTGCNRQNIKFLWLTQKQDVGFCQKIAGEPGRFVTQASHAVVVMADCRTYYLPGTRHQVYLEAGAAIENMLLYSHSIGIDSIWLNWAGINRRNQQFRMRFRLESYMLPVSMVVFGYRDQYNIITPVRKTIQDAIIKTN